jgi:hypothetical protein
MASNATPESQDRRGGRSLFRNPMTWVIVLGVTLAAGAYILYRRNQSSQSSQSASTAATPDSTDFSGEISTLQAEIADLQSGEGGEAAGGGGTGGGQQPGGGSGTPPQGGPPKGPLPPAQPEGRTRKPAMPANVSGRAASPNSIRLSWSRVSGATSYQAHVTYQGRAQGTVSTPGTSVTVTGLAPNRTYTAHVRACNTAGCSAETNGPVVRTPGAARAGESEAA